ncbi:MAG: hypothetical protein WC553_02625 [Patescibacteria group bacterium]
MEETRNTISVETEWKRVDKLLVSKEDASWAMAVLEAFKIFHQVLSEVSFGETTEDKIHNAEELFKDIRGVLAAEKVCRHILEDVGHRVTKSDANKATASLLQGILDMIGRDWQERGWFDRWLSGLNYFWETHPKLLAGMMIGLGGLIALVWFLADTEIGKWLTGVLVGFTHFVMSSVVLVVALGAIIVISLLLSLTFADRRRRR